MGSAKQAGALRGRGRNKDTLGARSGVLSIRTRPFHARANAWGCARPRPPPLPASLGARKGEQLAAQARAAFDCLFHGVEHALSPCRIARTYHDLQAA